MERGPAREAAAGQQVTQGGAADPSVRARKGGETRSGETKTAAPLAPGLEFPRYFTLPGVDGRQYSLSDFKGMKIMLLSWASW